MLIASSPSKRRAVSSSVRFLAAATRFNEGSQESGKGAGLTLDQVHPNESEFEPEPRKINDVVLILGRFR